MSEQPTNQLKSIAIMVPEYTVSQISYKLKSIVENEFTYIKIRGEVSGFKLAPSGHAYFSLKDNNSQIVRAKKLKLLGTVHPQPCVTCHLS